MVVATQRIGFCCLYGLTAELPLPLLINIRAIHLIKKIKAGNYQPGKVQRIVVQTSPEMSAYYIGVSTFISKVSLNILTVV